LHLVGFSLFTLYLFYNLDATLYDRPAKKFLIFMLKLRENRLYFSFEGELRLHLTAYCTTV